ncbi:MAG: NAD-dependent epimerase/dehydratase family protein [Thermoflexales bacterium]|nr:NAD-dependent epimerase/dehydratase family protein [Thermoflexales bacterium]
MKVLITGGAGFLGAALANHLVGAGHTVRAIDDLSAGDPTRLDPAVFFQRADVSDIPRLWSVLQGVEVVYHLAARVSVSESVLYPGDYNATNVGGSIALLQAMRDAGVRRIVLASSGAIYGDLEGPAREDATPHPNSPYAVSKLAAEHYIHTIGGLWGMETVALRIFNAYGPGQPYRNTHPPVVPSLVRQALSGGSIVVFGSGRQQRDFVYVDDVVGALAAALQGAGLSRLTLNVGSGTAISINDLVAAIGRVVGRDLTPLRVTQESGGVSYLCADLSRARERLGFEPRTRLEDGLARVVEAHRARR